MNSSQFSANNWPGPWTPASLPNRKYYRLRSTKPRTPSSEDAKSSLLAIGTREVDEIKQADFIVVDDDIQPTDGAYASLLTHAERNHIAIVTVADIKYGIGIFHAHIAALPEIRRQKSSPIKKPVQENWVGGQFGLIFGEEVVKYCKNNKNWAEAIQHEILLRDPIVREFIRHPRADLEAIVVSKPPRIIGTRWTLEDVRTDYVVEAWTPVGDREWRYQWDIAEFNETFMGSDEFTPEEAVRAALWEFFIENKDDVESLIW